MHVPDKSKTEPQQFYKHGPYKKKMYLELKAQSHQTPLVHQNEQKENGGQRAQKKQPLKLAATF